MAVSKASRSKRARVFVVDDHPIVRQGLALVIGGESDLAVCGETDNRLDALKIIAEQRPDVAVVDISLRDGNGLDLLKDIRARWPHLPVLMLSMHDEEVYAERALQAGAMGYIMKQEAMTTVLQAIRRILGGTIYLSERMQARFLRQIAAPCGKLGLERLTDRELQVFELMGQGLGTRRVARRLRLSVKTVESHLAHVKEKLAFKSGSELLQQATLWVAQESGVDQKSSS